MYKIFFTLISILLFLSCSTVNKHIKRAERYTQSLKIGKAISEYKKALELDKDNYKANAALGVMLCNYMNLHEDALPYLENAYLHSPKDTSADVIYALAKSYQFHGQFEKALEMLNKLNDAVATEDDDKEFQMDVKKRKADCQYALQHQTEYNSNIKIVNLGKKVNTSAPEYVPTFINDELFFTSKRKDTEKEKFNEWDGKYFEAMYTAKLKNGSPEKVDYLYIPTINKKIKPNSNRSIISVSGNKKYLFIFEDTKITQVPLDSISTQKNKPLTKTINMGYYQNHAYLTKDGKTLYFTSDAENGIGGLDIYVSRKNPDGSWSAPENLGSPINTEYDEDAPFLSDDEKTLYFASKGHPGFGNYDIFKSEWNGTRWSDPVNLGKPINSYGDDIFYIEDVSQTNTYFSSYRKGGYGDMDIYKILYLEKFRNLPPSNVNIGEIIANKQNDTTYHLSTNIPSVYQTYYPEWKIKNNNISANETDCTVPVGQKEKIYFEALLICDTCLNPIKIQLSKTIENTAPVLASNTAPNKIDIATLPKGEIPDNILYSLGFDTTSIYFDFDKTNIKDEYLSKINNNIELLKKYQLFVKVEGFSDLYGNKHKHQQISSNRAKEVYRYLVKNGLSKKQILEYKGKGALNYCNEKDLEKCPDNIHSRNRKVKIRVYKLN
ncbi:MAG: cell envelope biogenesis protein OmpA [Bacteroidia bacterium]|nr:MAG: cell envelope biogenesis protein OmpA [Bacteroidia bacterium]